MKARCIDFATQRVLVSGASRGIGYAIAMAFAEAGAELVVIADHDGIDRAASRIAEATGATVRGYLCDITDQSQVADLFGQVGDIDVFIGNAGLELITPISDLSADAEDRFRRIIEVNVIGTYLSTRAAVANMRKGGRIILTSSVWGKSAIGEFSAYVASKHANIGFMRSLARELGPRGIRVNCVCPGWVRTDAAMRSLRQMSVTHGRPEEDILGDVLASQCIGGLQTPGDVSQPYLFLASDMAENVTGQALNADRGEFLA